MKSSYEVLVLFQAFKKFINSQNNKNYKFVKIKSDRLCYKCNSELQRGTECLTVNPKGSGRRWYCNRCVSLLLDLSEVRAEMQSCAFDDEGFYMSLMDEESRILDEIYN